MDPRGALVLGGSTLLLALALLALLGRAGRSRLVGAWVAMVGFAGLAAFCFWTGVQLRRTAVPAYLPLPAEAGLQQVALIRPAMSPGYRVRLVRRDRTFDPDLFAKLGDGHWRITVGEDREPFCHVFNRDGVIEFDSAEPQVALRYEPTPAMLPLLKEASVELRCPAGFAKFLEQARATVNLRTAFFLGGLLLAGLGGSAQRRKLRSAALRPAASPAGSAE